MLYVLLGVVIANLGFTLLLFRAIEQRSYVTLTEALKCALGIEGRIRKQTAEWEAESLRRQGALLANLTEVLSLLESFGIGPPAGHEIAGAVARGWCYDRNKRKEMDTELASAIAAEVQQLVTRKRLNPLARGVHAAVQR